MVRWANCEVDLGETDSIQSALNRASETLNKVVDDAEDRIVATRVRFVGSTLVHTELQGKSQWLRQKLLQAAAELFGSDLWVERVVIDTSSKLDRGSLLEVEGALGGFARNILAVKEERGAVRGLDAAITAFREKLPPEVLDRDDGLRLDDQAVVTRLIEEAKELLLNKLLETGGES